MSGRLGDGRGDSPEDIDAAFAQIVADLEREGVGRALPDDPPAPEPEPEPAPAVPVSPGESWRGYQDEYDAFDDNVDEHYEPPEPPPLPRLRWPTLVAIGMLVVGVVLLLLPVITAMDGRFATPVGLVCLGAGIGLLLLRARPTSRLDPGDNGAEV
ncbi:MULTISPECIES: DUF308 domain-containing protein [Actinokineospora]|uniref:DUF308 domain-containing protein n=1 Tax=Actinokineospora fastidiosa TaxID=1816 RepID=A0A918GJM2_9PSEU|nr:MULTISPECIES: DUF308 domain-containing protein [Actinokineospora]UVS77868.1 hypothetical protein Actkin_01591 [Actinokineospora sp. UTMC 2448]GGS40443.1 hypothetical protein GCM10010171_38660 [Actinokineospora fastidiosa]